MKVIRKWGEQGTQRRDLREKTDDGGAKLVQNFPAFPGSSGAEMGDQESP